MKIDLHRLGGVTRNVGSPRFGQALFSLFNDAFDITSCSVVTFHASGLPSVVVSEGASPDDCLIVRRLAKEYVNGAYRYDPNVSNRNVARAPAVYGMRADELANTQYRRLFYDEPRISYELVQLTSSDGVLFYLSLYRNRGAAPFYSKDVIAMRQLGRFVVPAVQRHLDLNGELTSPSTHEATSPSTNTLDSCALLEHMRQVFLDAPHRLSQREAEVCAGIVLGYSTIAIGLNLQIAVNTVATHRKRAYKKLGICSQNELFTRYFENVQRIQLAPRNPRYAPPVSLEHRH
jgi:DNA-binding CsgD family transcriptional regulator